MSTSSASNAEIISDPYFDRSNFIEAEASYQNILLNNDIKIGTNIIDSDSQSNVPLAYNSWRDPIDPRYPLLQVENEIDIENRVIEHSIERTRMSNEEFLWLCICFRIFLLLLVIAIIVAFACL